MAPINAPILDDKLARLEQARPWSPRLISKFEAFLNAADDFQLFRINPYRFSSERGAGPAEVVDLFLHSVKVGILKMDWQVVCPHCGDAIESFGALEHVHSHYFCRLCQEQCVANLDDYIQVSFTVSPQVREIAYHDPASLPAEDFFFQIPFQSVRACAGRSTVR